MSARRFLGTLGAAAALAGCGAADPEVPAQPAAAGEADAATGHPLAGSIAEFRRGRRERDAIPHGMVSAPDMAEGMDVESSRRAGDARTWLVPGVGEKKDSLCVLTDVGANCPPATLLREKGVAPMVAWHDGRLIVTGVAADGVKEIVAVDAAGARTATRTANNTFRLEGCERLSEVRWTWRGTEHREPATVPAVADIGCS